MPRLAVTGDARGEEGAETAGDASVDESRDSMELEQESGPRPEPSFLVKPTKEIQLITLFLNHFK